ncbi:MAG: V-type ATPase subunit [Lentisphaerae bacterium]|nr:V-type ATPase subunit [Lentisphaerota bacterium]
MSDYAYINARVCSMRTGLLSRETIEELMTFESVQAVAERLLDTSYRTGLATSMAQREPLRALDIALDESLQECIQRILRMASGDARPWIQAFVDDWDVQAIKTVLRGVQRQLSDQTILDGVGPTARLTRRDMEQLAELADIRGIIDLLVSWSSPWGTALKSAWDDYLAEETLVPLEFALDVHRFKAAYALNTSGLVEDHVALQLLAAEAELTNVVQCLISVGGQKPPRLLPVAGGSSRIVRALAAANDLPQATAILAESRFREVLDIALPFMTHIGHLGMFERLLERERLLGARRLALQDPLSIAVVSHYLRCKRNEVTNIKLIARGVANGVVPSAIRAGLIFASES